MEHSCEACGSDGAQPIVIEVGRHALRYPTIRRKVMCFACVAHALVHVRPDDAAELCEFIGKFQFGENNVGSYKEIEKQLGEITADLLVNLPKGKKTPGPEQMGDATYRFNQLRLLGEIAKSLDSLAYNANQQTAIGKTISASLQKLEGHYSAMLKMQQKKNGPQPQGAPNDRQQG